MVQRFRNATGGWIRFSGGTPAIRLDADRFMAVGHLVGDISCSHEYQAGQVPVEQQLRKGQDATQLGAQGSAGHQRAEAEEEGDGVVPAAWDLGGRKTLVERQQKVQWVQKPRDWRRTAAKLSAHPCNASFPAPTNHHAWTQHFRDFDHHLPRHHAYWEYSFFIYTFSAHPPYHILEISHAFVPHELREHRGVYFPTGITRLPPSASKPGQQQEDATPSFLLMYGKVRQAQNLSHELAPCSTALFSTPTHYSFINTALLSAPLLRMTTNSAQ